VGFAAPANIFAHGPILRKNAAILVLLPMQTRLPLIDNVRHFGTVTIKQRESCLQKTISAAFAARR
jgi:hypothetical protein